MTKRHFKVFAKEIRESNRSKEERAAMFYLVVRVASQFSSHFNYERFEKATGVFEDE